MGRILNNLIYDTTAGLVCGISVVVLTISLVSIMFAGVYSPHIVSGISMGLTTSAVACIILALTSSAKLSIQTLQDSPAVIFAIIGVIIAQKMHGANSADITSTFILAIILTTLLTGLVFFILGILKLGNFIRFIPFPVIAGFLAGTGWLLFSAGWRLMLPNWEPSQIQHLLSGGMVLYWLPGLILVISYLIIQHYFKKPIFIPIIMVAGIAFFFLVVWYANVSIATLYQSHWLMGPFPKGDFWRPANLSIIKHFQWGVLKDSIGTMLVVAIISPIALLLNNSGLEDQTMIEMDFNKELKYTGFANIVALLLGGGGVAYQALSYSMAGHIFKAKTRLVGIIAGGVCIAVIIAGSSLISILPRFILASIVLFLGVELLIKWLYNSLSSIHIIDYMVIVIVFLGIVFIGLLQGIALGLLISLFIFIVKYSRVNVVKNALSGDLMQSNVERSPEEEAFLVAHGGKTLIIFLQGYLFFGNTNTIYHIVKELALENKPSHLLFDLAKVAGLDSSSNHSFMKTYNFCEKNKIQVIFTRAPLNLYKNLQAHANLYGPSIKIKMFSLLDEGLDWCERRLLQSSVSMKEHVFTIDDILKNIFPDNADRDEIKKMLEYVSVDSGKVIYYKGEKSEDMYFVLSGKLGVFLDKEGNPESRISVIGSGATFGEIGLYLESTRSATVIALEPCVLYRLHVENLNVLTEEHPRLALKLHYFIACHNMMRLIRANRNIEKFYSN